MGTRGTIGFRRRNKIYAIFVRQDAYPSSLGIIFCGLVAAIFCLGSEVRDRRIQLIQTTLDNCRHSDKAEPMTAYEFLNAVYLGELKEFQNSDFINDQVFCEWGYILDMDEMEAEVHQYGELVKKRTIKYGDTYDWIISDDIKYDLFTIRKSNKDDVQAILDSVRKQHSNASNKEAFELCLEKMTEIAEFKEYYCANQEKPRHVVLREWKDFERERLYSGPKDIAEHGLPPLEFF